MFYLAFITGFLGSLHCMGMCGPLAMAVPVPAGKRSVGILLYNIGRTATYMLLGLIFSTVGASIQLSGMQQYFAMGLGVALLLFTFVPIAGKKLEKSIYASGLLHSLRQNISAQFRQKSYRSTLLVGVLNGLLPCGMVYLAIAGAITSGDPFAGVVYMAIFSLGTMPAMVCMMSFRRLIPKKLKLNYVMLLSLVLGLVLLYRGTAMELPEISLLVQRGWANAMTVCGQ